MHVINNTWWNSMVLPIHRFMVKHIMYMTQLASNQAVMSSKIIDLCLNCSEDVGMIVGNSQRRI